MLRRRLLLRCQSVDAAVREPVALVHGAKQPHARDEWSSSTAPGFADSSVYTRFWFAMANSYMGEVGAARPGEEAAAPAVH